MKMPDRCPFCNDVMVNDFEYIWGILHKKCNKRVGHNLELIAKYDGNGVVDNDVVQYIYIIKDGKTYSWDMINYIYKIRQGKNETFLPWFEPNLSSYSKLFEKIKTYLVFL